MGQRDLPIIIAGGGIGGLACGLMLGKTGRDVKIFEQADQFGETGAGIQIGPNAFKMFDAMGIRQAINQVAVFPDALVMMDALSGEQVTRVPLNNGAFKKHFPNPYAVIYRPDLHDALLKEVRKLSNVSLITNCTVKDFIDHTDHVEVTTSQGSEKAAALVGADGLWSTTRSTLRGTEKPRISGHIAYRAVLPADQVPEANRKNEVILWAGPRTHLVHYPLHRGEIFNLVAVFHSDRYEEGWDVFGDVSELKRRFAGQHQNVSNMLEKIESWRMWVLCDREPIKNWSKGRVTLLGDAAHPTMQYLAQGACMAMEDAVCLANKLDQHEGNFEAAFQSYQQARYLRTARVQLTSRVYGDIYHAENVTAELRQMMLGGRGSEAAYAGMHWLYEGVNDKGEQIL